MAFISTGFGGILRGIYAEELQYLLGVRLMEDSIVNVFDRIRNDRSTFKIVTKTRNEDFFIEKWIVHHLAILQDVKIVIFDNMSDNEYVHEIYRKYKDKIILAKFDMYMDTIHMGHKFIQLYKALAESSRFFTIIDSDEFLYFYDGNRVVKDGSMVEFLAKNSDCNFFAPCWIENIEGDERLFSFNPKSLSMFNWGKPIINRRMVPLFESLVSKREWPILHHTVQLPIQTHGKAPTRFLLLHMKNLNKYQRIKSNMQKLVALGFAKNANDFSALLKIDLDTIQDVNLYTRHDANARRYIIETRGLVESLHATPAKPSEERGTVELCDDGLLAFSSRVLEDEFIRMMNGDYFDLINLDMSKIGINSCPTILSCVQK